MNTTVRVGYLTYGLDREPTGIGRYAVEMLRSLAMLPDRPEVVLLTTERLDPHGLWDTFEHHALPGCRSLPGLMTMGNGLISLAARRHQLGLIHDPNGIVPFLGPRAGARRIASIHDAFTYVHPDSHNWLDNWRYRHYLPSALRQADMVITVSKCSRYDIIHHLGLSAERVQVIAEGVAPQFRPVADTAERRAALTRYGVRQPYLLYVGGINARKNIARVFQAYARVRTRCPALTLVVAGKRQWQTDNIDAAFRQLDLESSVHFTGYVHDVDLPALYSAAELFVFPSLYEGFGLPPLESMACGTPVVTANTSSLPEVVGDAALSVDPYDVEGLSEAIMWVLNDRALRTELRWRGIKQAAQFKWEHVARKTLGIYEEVLTQTEGRAR